MPDKYAIFTTKTAGDQTIGAAGLTHVHGEGLDALTTLTLLDGTAIKLSFPVATTSIINYSFQVPHAFRNLIIDATGTGTYSIGYVPTS
jgi:hypothetical protein